MKTITIAGNVGKDAEIRRTQDGTPVASWSVAVEDRAGKEKSTMWFDVSLWGVRGERLAQHITKGTKIVVTGDLGTREYNGKTYHTVRADNVTMLGGGGPKYEDVASGDQPARGSHGEIEDDLGSIPF